MNTEITATATGATNSITLPDGIWNIFITSSSWGSANLQVSYDNSTWFNVQENSADVVFTSNSVKEINGGLLLRLDVGTYVANIILTAKKVI